MLRIRLKRVGKKKQPSYRIVVADVRAPRDGAFVEHLGHYNPLTDPPTVVINEEKVRHWLSVGAKPSDTVSRILQKQGVLEKAEA
jgi:small subunit ribosomal protein S16